jgi:pseudaminic acid cytidylyltransferase
MSRVAIITARGGSKRIPRKNIRDFFGKPIISYAIETAISSGLFDEVMVSTDDKEIAEVAEKSGAKVPFFRSPENSNDFAGTLEVLKEVISTYQKNGSNFDEFCCIYPTTPLLTSSKLIEASQLLSLNHFDFVCSVTKFSKPIQRALRMGQDGRVGMIDPSKALVRSQDLEPCFHDAGQFYIGKTKALLEAHSLFNANTGAIEIDEMNSQDVDDENDWKLLEYKFSLRKNP